MTFTADVTSNVATLVSPVEIAGLEERRGEAYDYNDLIFAFRLIVPVTAPEPSSIVLLCAGLVGAGMVCGRRFV